MKSLSKVLILAIGLHCVPQGQAGEIAQPISTGAMNIFVYGPMGQTFTAVDPQLSTIGFYLENGFFSSPTTITYGLLSGHGLTGTLLASNSFVLPQIFAGYADADFSSVSVTVGQTYTVVISTSTTDWLADDEQSYALATGQPIPGTVDYPGGNAIISGQDAPYHDLTFRVVGVPEPDAGVLVLAGMGVLLFCARKLKITYPGLQSVVPKGGTQKG